MIKSSRIFVFSVLVAAVLIISCNSNFTPKPKGFFKILFPEKQYTSFNKEGYPYSFEYPVYADVIKDSTFFGEDTENPWWINVNFPQFNGKIFISYKEIGKNTLAKLIADAYTLTNKHTVKATGKEDSLMVNQYGVHGVFFKVLGDVATSYQFFLTDSVHHFLRGAMYLEATPNSDSAKPVNDFILQDMKHLISTFNWKKQ